MKRKLSHALLITIGAILFLSAQLLFSNRIFALTASNTITTWSWGLSSFHDMEFYLSPLTDPSPQSYAYEYSFTFVGGSASGASFGMWTDFSGQKALVYEVYGSTGCAPAVNAHSGSLTGGGYFLYLPYSWTVGDTYAMQVKALGPASSGKECGVTNSGAGWGAYVMNTTTGASASIGELDVPSNWSGMSNSTSEQMQYLGPALGNCSMLAPSKFNLTGLVGDAATQSPGRQSPTGHSNSLQAGNCLNSMVSDISGGVQQEMGIYPPSPPPPPPPPPPGPGPSPSPSPTPQPKKTGHSTSPGNPTSTKTSNTVGSITVPFTTNSQTSNGSASSSTSLKSKHKSSALKTAAALTGVGILTALLAWLGYLMFTRYIIRKGSAKSNLDSDLFLGQPPANTTLPKPADTKIASPTHHSKNKLTKEEYIEFGQEVLLLEELKEQDKGTKGPLDPTKDAKPKSK